eukprot:205338_1
MDAKLLELRMENGKKLAVAAREHDIESTHLLLSEPDSLDPNVPIDDYGCTALQIACARGYTEIARALLANKSVDVNIFSVETPPRMSNGSINLMSILGPRMISSLGRAESANITPLLNAIHGKHTDIVGLLLESDGIDLYRREGSITLLYMAVKSKSIEIIRLLLEYPKIDLKREMRAFQTAIASNLSELLSLFLNHKQFDDLLSVKSSLPCLHIAVLTVSTGVSLRMLLESDKFNINEQSLNGPSVLEFCAKNNREEMVKILLARDDIDTNSSNSTGETALHAACSEVDVYWNNKTVALLLADERTDPNLLNRRNQTPLMCAAERGNVYLAEALVACERVNVSFKEPTDGWTALHFAAFKITYDHNEDEYQLIRTLIRAGADVFARASDCRIPRDLCNHIEGSEILAAAERDVLTKLLTRTTVCHDPIPVDVAKEIIDFVSHMYWH